MQQATQLPNQDQDQDQDPSPERGLSDKLHALYERTEAAIHARPFRAMSAAALAGFAAGSLTPRLVARPLGAFALRSLLARVMAK